MRDIAILLVTFAGLIGTVRYPFIGVILWTWLTLMVPHQQAFGFISSFPVNLIVAVVTILAWFFSKEPKKPPVDATFILVAIFLVWITINGFMAVNPGWSWPLWDRTWRIIALGILISITAINRTRIHALLLTMVLSLIYFGLKGGVFTIVGGGTYRVIGPPASMIGDNNHLALAILMALPLANYLRLHSKNILARNVLLTAMVLSLVSVLGSYSRGAFIAMAGLLVIAWFRAKRKLLYPIVAAAIVIPALQFMPQSFVDRMNSIQTAQSDSSFTGRLDAWHVAFSYAVDHFPFGAGFSGPELAPVFARYEPGKVSHAAHSIYFQVLGDNGFVGLAIYLALLWVCFWNTFTIRKLTKKKPELLWAHDLAGMFQLMLFVFCVGGAALSLAYYDMLFIGAGLLSSLKYRLRNDVAALNDQKALPESAAEKNRKRLSSEEPEPALS
jgi:probable O-glycosylation ligase (exosortase A-associated)